MAKVTQADLDRLKAQQAALKKRLKQAQKNGK